MTRAVHLERAVLHIENDEIEPGCGCDFDHHRTRGENNETHYGSACAKPLPDGIALQRHGLMPRIEVKKLRRLSRVPAECSTDSYRTVPR
jgi:hypothetical protein